MVMLFSRRYEKLFNDDAEEAWFGGEPDGDVSYEAKVRLARVMMDFHEPVSVQPDRYDNFTMDSDALTVAINELNYEYDAQLVDLNISAMCSGVDETHALANVYTPNLFDAIELQYEELSDDLENGKEGFRKEINRVFQEYDCPWHFTDGRLVKIDAKQFEQDLKLKALELMKDLKDASPVYQSAYEELRSAFEFLRRGDYSEAVTNAEKSYESVLKVICGSGMESSAANELTNRILADSKLALPGGIKDGAFQSNVLMSLPFIRNHAAAHGAGASECKVDEPLANLAVNLACAINTYLIQETTSEE